MTPDELFEMACGNVDRLGPDGAAILAAMIYLQICTVTDELERHTRLKTPDGIVEIQVSAKVRALDCPAHGDDNG